MSTLALQLIEEAQKNKSTSLDLGRCGLTEIPRELYNLKEHLEELNLSDRYWDVDVHKWIESSNNGSNNSIKCLEEEISCNSHYLI